MTFSEKMYDARLALNLSQIELAEKVGISERSIYNYEQAGIFPRYPVLQKLAEALNVTVAYLTDDDETDKMKNIDEELFISNVKNEYGSKGAREAQAVIERATVLLAGGELDENAREIFLQSLHDVYLESKAEAREKFSPKRRKKRKL